MKNKKNISQRIKELLANLAAMEKKIGNGEGLPDDIPNVAIEDFQNLVEELNVAIEELQVQNDELQIQRQLVQKERERYKDLFEFAPDGYLVTDRFGTIHEANRIACLMLNVLPNRVIGKPLTVFIEKQSLHEFRNFLSSIHPIDSQGFLQKDFLIQPRDEKPFPASLTVTISPGSVTTHQNDFGLRWSMQDITERLRLMDKLQKSNEELEQRVAERTEELVKKNKELQDFAFMASHDLEEPLRKIRVFGGLIKENYADQLPEIAVDYFERMLKANQRMDDMLQGLLNYSRITTMAKVFEPVDLDEVLDGVLFDLELAIEKNQASIERAELPTVEADTNQMRQLLQNLVINALKFHEPDEAPQIKIWAAEAGDGLVKIMVQDNGIGFSEAMREEIFQPFRRLNPHTAYQGSGMGLSICKKIVERHHGQIQAHSTLHKGSTFTVVLPRQQPEASDVKNQ